jgi:CHRD domain
MTLCFVEPNRLIFAPLVQCLQSLYYSVLNNAQNEHTNCAQRNAMGSALATLTNSQFCIRLSYSGLSNPELFSHIHGPGLLGVVAPIQFTLGLDPTKNACYTFNSTQIDWLNAGLLYFNIHTNATNCTPGEIRGQILRSA